ncbi:MAG: NAD-dependent epimerase/dehydratase family protein [Armatimonadetes bacterium]|nr:NAD-dependent epimerase/dehydratase family protein [Armatimonadota bacterium]
MRALVTGATGFVGGHVAAALCRRGHEVRALVRAGSRTEGLAGLGVTLCTGDLLGPASLRAAMQGCDAIFHVAADYRLWAWRPQDLYDTNVTGTANVMHAALEARVAKVVYTSTVGVLGPDPSGVADEETPSLLAQMTGHYKRSKFLAEERVRYMHREHGLPVTIIMPSTPVGEGDARPTPTGRIITDFLNWRTPATVPTGLNIVDVRDVAEGHALAWERGAVGRRYILGNRDMPLRELLGAVARIADGPAPTVEIPYWAARCASVIDTWVSGSLLGREPRIAAEAVRMAARCMYFSPRRAVEELGLPQSDVEAALARAVDWFQRNGYVRGATQGRQRSTR